jgi:hypothetical protein
LVNIQFRRDSSPLFLAPSVPVLGRVQDRREKIHKNTSQRERERKEDPVVKEKVPTSIPVPAKEVAPPAGNPPAGNAPAEKQEQRASVTPPPPLPPAPPKDSFETSLLGVQYLAEIRRIDAMDMLFPQTKHDQVRRGTYSYGYLYDAYSLLKTSVRFWRSFSLHLSFLK